MPAGPNENRPSPLSPDERRTLEDFRSCSSLPDLVSITGAPTKRDAYFTAKQEWASLRSRELAERPVQSKDGLPGSCTVIGEHEFWVHGITHSATDEERSYLRSAVSTLTDDATTVYCEQGIRSMYFDDHDGVCVMDDYRWAMDRCDALEGESSLSIQPLWAFDDIRDDLESIKSQVRSMVYSLVDSGGDLYGERVERALGELVSSFFVNRAEIATGAEFESYRKSTAAATDPSLLCDLQRYYETVFLPQPIERAWLRRHDPGLELLTHARNERMADYACFHNESARSVHVIVGAAHQPGVRYYLEQHRDGYRSTSEFELME